MKTKRKKVLCFQIPNYDQVNSSDPFSIPRLEEALALAGALPARSYIVEGITTYCVTIENPDLSEEDVLNIFRKLGFQAQMKGEQE